jgi:hypothetical protein
MEMEIITPLLTTENSPPTKCSPSDIYCPAGSSHSLMGTIAVIITMDVPRSLIFKPSSRLIVLFRRDFLGELEALAQNLYLVICALNI